MQQVLLRGRWRWNLFHLGILAVINNST